ADRDRLGNPPGQQIRQQRHEAEGIDGFRLADPGELLQRPPVEARGVRGLIRLEAADVDVVRAYPVEEEVVTEPPLGPAQVGVAAGERDVRTQLARCDDQAGFLPQLANGCV